ncbi:MAG: Ig-like domain-containing protein, partial [Planctomycetota bacterium]
RLADDDGGIGELDTVVFVGERDTVAPTLDIVDVTPDPRNTNVGTVAFHFDEAVRGFDLGDLELTRGGTAIDLSTLDLRQLSPARYEIDLASVTESDGEYELRVLPETSGVTDLAGNAMTTGGSDQFTIDTLPPRVESLVYDDESGQRSVVRSITVTFDSIVQIDEGAFSVRSSTNEAVGVQVQSSVVNGKTRVLLTFSGSLVDSSGSLQDGNYRLTILDTHVRDFAGNLLDGDADGSAGANAADDFYRLFGDVDGDRDVDGQDYGRFASAFLKSTSDAGYIAAFDSDNDGDIDGQDYGRFAQRIFTDLPE